MLHPILDSEALELLLVALEAIECAYGRVDDPDLEAELEQVIQTLTKMLSLEGNA